jgi:hypothetical protein
MKTLECLRLAFQRVGAETVGTIRTSTYLVSINPDFIAYIIPMNQGLENSVPYWEVTMKDGKVFNAEQPEKFQDRNWFLTEMFKVVD